MSEQRTCCRCKAIVGEGDGHWCDPDASTQPQQDPRTNHGAALVMIADLNRELADLRQVAQGLRDKVGSLELVFELKSVEHNQCHESADKGWAKVADLQAKLSVARELIDGASTIIEIFAVQSLSQAAWKKEWLAKAKQALLQLEGQDKRGMTHEDTACDNATDGREATE